MRLRGVVLGLGQMGRHHSRVLQTSPRVVYVGGVEIRRAVGGVEGERVYPSLDYLLTETAGIDFAVIALPTSMHAEASVALAEEGVNLLIEKPLALKLAEGASIIEACERGQIHAAVGHVERYNPALVKMKQLLASGDLGRPTAIITERTGPAPRGVRDAGVISDLATHDLDLIPWLVDEPIDTLSAQTSSPFREHLAFVTGRMASGIVFNTVVDWLSPVRSRRVRVVCDEGTFVADTLNPSLVRLTKGAAEIPLPPVNPLAAQIDAFCDLLLGDAEAPVVSLEEGLRAVACAEAALRSAHEQRVITL
jgi:UDP-N-acetylglucosamine 3-dehydrogenase